MAAASTFGNVVETIVASSPTLAADNARMQSELEALKAEGIPADPEVEFEHLWNGNGGENRWSAGISQEIDWPGIYRARARAIGAQSRLTEARQAARLTEARTAATSLLIEIIAAKKEVAILEEIDSSMRQLREKTLTAWNNGETTIIDLNKINIEAARNAARLEKAGAAVEALMAELQAMTAPETDIKALLESFDALELPLEPLETADTYLNALGNSPAMVESTLAIDAAQAQTALAKSRRMPGFSIGYAHAYEEGTHFNGITAGVRLPLWSRRSSVSAAAEAALAARFEATAARTALAAKVSADHAAATGVRRQMAAYAPAVEGTNNLALLRKAFEGGELSMLTYLQEVNYFLEARLDYLALTKEYALLSTSLNRYLTAR